MSKNKLQLNEFSPVLLKEWEEKINKDLKGKSLSELEWTQDDGISLSPYFNKENSKNYQKNESELKSKSNTKKNDWETNTFIKVNNEKEGNKKALKALKEGSNSLTFRGDNLNLTVLLEGIMIEIIAIHFITKTPTDLIQKLKDLCLARSITFIDLDGSISFDYLGNYARKGKWLSTEENITKELHASFNIAKEADLRTICASNSYFEKSGATVSQQIAISLAQGTEYLNILTSEYKAEEIARKIQFSMAIGGNYFLEIAKIRAFRMLWSKVLTAFESTYTTTIIQGTTSTLFWSNSQPKNNMLRATSSAMSGILGGCDSLTVVPFDEVANQKEKFSERVATNVQLILNEESYFDKVVDPANGSYFIENLTEEIAELSWKIFQEIEEKGGFEIGDMTVNQQEKIEELFLHTIAINKENKALKAENETLKKRLEAIEKHLGINQ